MSESTSKSETFSSEGATEREFLKMEFLPAIGISAGLILVFEIIYRFILNPEENPAHAYIGYMTGIIILGLYSFMVRSKLKGLGGSLLLILFSFIPPLILKNVFYGLFSVLEHTVEVINEGLEAITLIDPNFTNPLQNPAIKTILDYAFVFDLLFALFICLPAAGVLSWLIKSVTKKPSGKTLIGIPFLLVFLLIFVLLLPFTLVGVAGTSQFAVNMGVGGIYLQEAFGVIGNSSAANMQEAFGYLDNATYYFKVAESNFDGLNSMGMFFLLGVAMPSYRPLIDNGVMLVQGAVKLAQSVTPFAKGVFTLGDALSTVFEALGISNSSSSFVPAFTQTNATNTINETLFEKGIALLGAASANLTQGLKEVRAALENMKNLDYNELATFMQQNFGDNSTIWLVKDGTELFEKIINVLYIFLDPAKTGPNTNENALQLLMRGFKDLKIAGDLLGGSSMFNNTEEVFSSLTQHLEPVVQYTLADAVVNDFLNTPSFNSPELNNILEATKSAIRFFRDSSIVTLNFGEFGLLVGPIYDIGTSVLNEFQGNLTEYGNFTQIPLTNYDNEWIPRLTEMYVNATALNNTAYALDISLENMKNNATAGNYGFFNDQSTQLAELMGDINYTKEAENIKGMSGKLLSIITAIRWLKITDDKYFTLKALSDSANYSDSDDVAQLLSAANELDQAVNISRLALENAVNNKTDGMSQMSSIDNSLSAMINAMDNKIIPGINTIKSELNNVDPDNSPTVVSDALDQIISGLEDVSTALSGLKL